MGRWTAFAVMVGALLLAGCSASQKKTSPIWDQQSSISSPAGAERTNLWPVYYHNSDAVSVLWPLFTRTEEGSALWPLYDHNVAARQYRYLSIHNAIPGVALIDYSVRYWRVLTVAHDGERQKFYAIPLFIKTQRHFYSWIFYKEPRQFWTPLVTWGDSVKGVAGPLLFRHQWRNQDGTSGTWWAAPWPFVGIYKSNRVEAIYTFPLVFYKDRREGPGRWVNIGLPLFNYNRDKSTGATRVNYLWPLGWSTRKPEEKHHGLFPLYMSFDKPNRDVFLSLPYTSVRSDTFRFTSLMAFAGWFSGQESKGGYLFPLAYAEKRDGKPRMFTVLGGRYRKDRVTYTNILGPLFLDIRNGETAERYTSLLFPILHAHHEKGERIHAIAPLASVYTRQGVSQVLTPAVSVRRGKGRDQADFVNVGMLVGHWFNTSKASGVALLSPFIKYRRTHDGRDTSHYVFPAYYSRRNAEKRKVDLALGLLYFGRSMPGDSGTIRDRVSLQFRDPAEYRIFEGQSLYQYMVDRATSTSSITVSVNEREVIASKHVRPYFRSMLLGTIGWRRQMRAELRGPREQVEQYFRAFQSANLKELPIPASMIQWEESSAKWFFIFFKERRGTNGSESNILWRLYDAERQMAGDQETLLRRRVLWKLYDYQRSPAGEGLDLFPFISKTTTRDMKRTRFAGGLYEYRREGDTTRIRILFAPVK